MANATLRQRFRYRFDTFIGRGGGSIFMSLLIAFIGTLVLVGVVRGFIHLVHPEGAKDFDDVFAHLYVVFLNLSDPGTMVVDIPSSPVRYRVESSTDEPRATNAWRCGGSCAVAAASRALSWSFSWRAVESAPRMPARSAFILLNSVQNASSPLIG